MLLCDGCDRGHHTHCLRPRLKVRVTRPPLAAQRQSFSGGVLTQEEVFGGLMSLPARC